MSERFGYFAYGSNMFSRRLRMRTPSALVISIGFVEGYRLSFDKPSRRDGSGKCNIRPTNSPADRVYGVLFSILRDEEPALDKAEGLGKGYEKSQFKVTTSDGPCFAAAYVGEEANPLLLPYDWYKEFVVRGAIEHKLPASYVRRLQIIEVVTDLKDERRRENEAILNGE